MESDTHFAKQTLLEGSMGNVRVLSKLEKVKFFRALFSTVVQPQTHTVAQTRVVYLLTRHLNVSNLRINTESDFSPIHL